MKLIWKGVDWTLCATEILEPIFMSSKNNEEYYSSSWFCSNPPKGLELSSSRRKEMLEKETESFTSKKQKWITRENIESRREVWWHTISIIIRWAQEINIVWRNVFLAVDNGRRKFDEPKWQGTRTRLTSLKAYSQSEKTSTNRCLYISYLTEQEFSFFVANFTRLQLILELSLKLSGAEILKAAPLFRIRTIKLSEASFYQKRFIVPAELCCASLILRYIYNCD